ncbi:MAG: hypothetical protein ACXWYM_00195 [Candidatus Binatia bacterium]
MSKKGYDIDAKAFIKFLGGQTFIAAEHEKLRANYDYDFLSINTIHSWVRNGSIPLKRLADLFHIADVNGVDADLRKFIRKEQISA